jgi:hypothetical protein
MDSTTEAAQLRRGTGTAPVMLVPEFIERMIMARQAVQLAKFRTTYTDCMPNW